MTHVLPPAPASSCRPARRIRRSTRAPRTWSSSSSPRRRAMATGLRRSATTTAEPALSPTQNDRTLPTPKRSRAFLSRPDASAARPTRRHALCAAAARGRLAPRRRRHRGRRALRREVPRRGAGGQGARRRAHRRRARAAPRAAHPRARARRRRATASAAASPIRRSRSCCGGATAPTSAPATSRAPSTSTAVAAGDLVARRARGAHRLARRVHHEPRSHARTTRTCSSGSARPWLIDHGAALYAHHDWASVDEARTRHELPAHPLARPARRRAATSPPPTRRAPPCSAPET